MLKRLLKLWTVPLLFSISSPTLALPVLDQSFEPSPVTAVGSLGGIFSSFSVAQTATVGIPGKLASIDFFMVDIGTNNTSSVDIQIFSPEFLGSQLDLSPSSGSQLLATGVSITGHLIPEIESFVTFDLLPADLEVTQGQLLAIVLSSNGPPGTEFQVVGGTDGYPDGKGYHGDGLLDPFGVDFGFRIFVESATVPEPSILTVFSLGLAAGLGLMGNRRKQQSLIQASKPRVPLGETYN